MARWITIIKAPFDYVWPGRSAISHFSKLALDTEQFVKDEIADFAVSKGFARDGRISDATAKSDKGVSSKPKRVRRKRAEAIPSNRREIDAPKTTRERKTKAVPPYRKDADEAAIIQPDSGVDGASDADNGAASNGSALDPASS